MLKNLEKRRRVFSKRILAVCLCAVLLVTTFAGIMVFNVNAGQVEYSSVINNYYPLKGGYSDPEFYKDSDWSFEGRNFMETADFETSSKDFAAPDATVATDGRSADIKWSAVDSAIKYRVDIFEGTTRQDSVCKTVTETNAVLEGLTPSTRYAIQILALDAQDGVIKASKVREIVTYSATENQNVILDGTSTAGTRGFNISKYPTAADSALSYNGGMGEWKTNDFGTATLPDRVEAFAFWFGQSNSDGSTDNWLFPDFKLGWSYTGNNGKVSSTFSGTNVKVYFVSEQGEVYTNLRGSNDYNLWHFKEETNFKQGFVVIPVGIYKNGASLAGKENVKFSLALQNLREYKKDSATGNITQTGNKFGNRTMYFDNFCTISDLNLFLGSLEDVSYSASKEPIYACDDADTDKKTFTNSEFGSKYSYVFGGDQGISYNLKDTGTGLYGMSLKFTSPETSTYDVSNYIKVINNSIEASVYYRLIKEDTAGDEKQIWPQNGWYQMNANSSNFNPASPLELQSVYLKKNEKLRFEAYADVMSSSGGEVNIKLVNTYLVPTETKETSKGTVTTYPSVNYMDCFHTTGDFSNNRYVTGASRWNFSAMDLNDYSVVPLVNYTESWGRMTYRNLSGGIVGVYTDIYNNSATLKTQTNSKNGVRMDFTSTQSGTAVISMQNVPTSGSAPANLRIMLNDEQIYPVGAAWTQAPDQFSVSCAVKSGDLISIQQYCTSGNTMNGVPTVSIYTGNTANLAGSTYYSALRERPWQGKTYNGEWDQTGNIWKFNLYNNAVVAGDSFSSDDDGLVYNSELGKSDGYRFTDKEIIFDISEAKRGFSMDFNVPLTGFYAVGYALKILEGNGKISYRIRKGNTQLYPSSGWGTVEGETAVNECHELELTAGTVLTIDAYAADLSESITLSLGDPTIVYNNEFNLNENGKCAVYNAFTFLNQEKGYTGPITLDNKRFVYEIVSDSLSYGLNYSDVQTGKFAPSENSLTAYQLIDNGLKMLLPDSAVGTVTLTSPRQGYANIFASAVSADNSEFTVTVYKNDQQLYSQTSAAHEIDVYSALEVDDVITVTASGSDEIIWYAMGASVDGVYDNENDASASVFTASLVLPYGDDTYVGKYKASEKIWNFGTYYPENDKVKAVDYYDSKNNKHLYEKASGVGYYFDNKLLFADLKEKDSKSVGVSLDFVAPYDETFELFSGLQIAAPTNASADVYVRITKNGEVVWPADGNWNKTEAATEGQDVIIPMQYLELVKGDRVALQIYAENINAADNTVKISLAAPRIRVHDVVRGNTDFTAFVYGAGRQRPFIGMDYAGKYYHTEGMWNFEFLDFLPQGTKTDTPVTVKGNDFSINKITSNLGNVAANYQIGDSSTTVVSYATVDSSANRIQTTGQSMRFVSPIDGTVELFGTPVVSSLVANQKAYFRVLHNGETIYPIEGGWEELDNVNNKSKFVGVELDILKGEEICYQFYTDAEDSAIVTMSNRRATATFKLNPAVVYYDYISASKTSFKFLTDITTELQLSPFWKAEYKMDRESDEWTELEKHHSSWNLWLNSNESMGWSTNYAQAWIKNGFGKTVQPIVSATYTAHATGYVKINKMGLAISNNVVRFPANVRITQNGETVWPVNEEWALVTLENKPSVSALKFAITEGDKIRFEVSPAEPMEVGAMDLKVDIGPQFTYTKYDEVYSKDKDIFGMLDEQTYKYFKELAANQFDTNPDATMKYSSEFMAAIAQRDKNWLEKISASSANPNKGGTTTVIVKPAVPDQYIPGTESKVIKRRKKVVATMPGGMPIWGIVLIVVGAVLAVGTTIFFVVFIRKKKKRKANGEKQ